MNSNNQEQGAEVTGCEMCGDGYSPDERMQFSNTTTAAVFIKRAYRMMEEIQTRALTMECLLAKAIHLEHQWATTDTDRPYGETL